MKPPIATCANLALKATISPCISDYNTRKGNLVATRVADYEFISSQFLMAIAFSPHALLPRHSNYCTLVNFSSCQRNLIKTFQIEGMIALIAKMDLIFS